MATSRTIKISMFREKLKVPAFYNETTTPQDKMIEIYTRKIKLQGSDINDDNNNEPWHIIILPGGPGGDVYCISRYLKNISAYLYWRKKCHRLHTYTKGYWTLFKALWVQGTAR